MTHADEAFLNVNNVLNIYIEALKDCLKGGGSQYAHIIREYGKYIDKMALLMKDMNKDQKRLIGLKIKSLYGLLNEYDEIN